ncbi:ankyrin repeat-containing protein, putative [Ricinus communis]|uniref:Ankyrin repeat-containing protein, putative n=1 Tax=Ricinus communis TaxID=3988 RepID=B9T154_RICCO|nr:ankyrin repeat-containing protein, putative [Ricinus communis]
MTIQSDTAFHIAVRNNKIEAFQVLTEWLKNLFFEDAAFWEREILNWKNKEGNSVLHIATLTGQHQVAELLMKSYVYSNIKNSNGIIAMDISQDQTLYRGSWRFWIRQRLYHGILSTNTCNINELKKISPENPIALRLARSRMKISPDRRKTQLVVYALIATIMY